MKKSSVVKSSRKNNFPTFIVALFIIALLVFLLIRFDVLFAPSPPGGTTGGPTITALTNPKTTSAILTTLTGELGGALNNIDAGIEEDAGEWVYFWVVQLNQAVTVGGTTFASGSTLVCLGLNAGGQGGGVICHDFTPSSGGPLTAANLASLIGAIDRIRNTMDTDDEGEEIGHYTGPLNTMANLKLPGGKGFGAEFGNGGSVEEWFDTTFGGTKSRSLHKSKLEGSKIDW